MTHRFTKQKLQQGLEGIEKKLNSEGKRQNTEGFKERTDIIRRIELSIKVFLLDWYTEMQNGQRGKRGWINMKRLTEKTFEGEKKKKKKKEEECNQERSIKLIIQDGRKWMRNKNHVL